MARITVMRAFITLFAIHWLAASCPAGGLLKALRRFQSHKRLLKYSFSEQEKKKERELVEIHAPKLCDILANCNQLTASKDYEGAFAAAKNAVRFSVERFGLFSGPTWLCSQRLTLLCDKCGKDLTGQALVEGLDGIRISLAKQLKRIFPDGIPGESPLSFKNPKDLRLGEDPLNSFYSDGLVYFYTWREGNDDNEMLRNALYLDFFGKLEPLTRLPGGGIKEEEHNPGILVSIEQENINFAAYRAAIATLFIEAGELELAEQFVEPALKTALKVLDTQPEKISVLTGYVLSVDGFRLLKCEQYDRAELRLEQAGEILRQVPNPRGEEINRLVKALIQLTKVYSMRVWFDSSGVYEQKARFVSLKSDEVRLLDDKGEDIKVSLDALSTPDQRFAKQAQRLVDTDAELW